MPWQ